MYDLPLDHHYATHVPPKKYDLSFLLESYRISCALLSDWVSMETARNKYVVPKKSLEHKTTNMSYLLRKKMNGMN